MDNLKIWFADFWPEWKDEDFITPILKKSFNVVLDGNNPDVVFLSIFGNSHTKYKCKKILFVAENIRYSYNQTIRDNINLAFSSANYTITFDPHTDKNYRLPLWQVYILRNPEYLSKLIKRVQYDKFDRFCSFTVSNPSNSFRNGFYYQLNSYKIVHSYGRFLTNSYELIQASEGKYWREAKDEFFKNNRHKYSVAFENTSYPYYCTEKLMDAFLAGSVPLYWGDPKAREDWNRESFIDIMRGGFDLIKKAEDDPAYFKSLYEAPVFTDEQKNKLENNLMGFEQWLTDKTKV